MAINSKTKLHNQFGCGSFRAGIPGKRLAMAQVLFPRSGEKSAKNTDLKEKWRTATYHIIFDQDKHTQGNGLPPASQSQVWRKENTQATMLEQEQAMIPKRFSKLTALQLILNSSTSGMITDKLLIFIIF